MHLIIQIPSFNEESTLPSAIGDLPHEIAGVDRIEYLVIDDGSSDRTAEVAKECGAHHVLRLGSNRGLATAFKLGVDRALELGADIVVNTDADNQYRGEDISKLVLPIVEGKADLVVGCRPIADHPEFSWAKKLLQRAGSWTLRRISRTTVRDAASGFRAFSRRTCQRIFIHTRFSYCMETLIQAGNSGLRVESVDIRVNPKTRDSRLFRSVFQYVVKSGGTMLAMFALYRPGRFFSLFASVLLLVALFLGLRYIVVVYVLATPGRNMLQSLILLSISAFASFLLFALGAIGELLRANRKILEEVLYLNRRHGNHDERGSGARH